jgi:hypothetical protein
MIAVQIKVRQKNTQHSKVYKILGADDKFEKFFVVRIHYDQLYHKIGELILYYQTNTNDPGYGLILGAVVLTSFDVHPEVSASALCHADT